MEIPQELTKEEKQQIREFIQSDECPEYMKKYLNILSVKNKNCMEKVLKFFAVSTVVYDFFEENNYDDIEEFKKDLKKNLYKNYNNEFEKFKELMNLDGNIQI